MGMFYDIRIFKGPTAEEFSAALHRVAKRLNKAIRTVPVPNPKESKIKGIRTSTNNNVHSLFLEPISIQLEGELAKELKTTSMVLRLHDSDVWYYILYDGLLKLDEYCTYPACFDDDDDFIKARRGKPAVLARMWGLTLKSVKAFVRPHEDSVSDVQDNFFEFMKFLGATEPIWVTYRLD